jgi:hypothetical protein
MTHLSSLHLQQLVTWDEATTHDLYLSGLLGTKDHLQASSPLNSFCAGHVP